MQTLDQLKKSDIPQEVESAANAYLMARAHAETVRKHVDAIQRDILSRTNYRPDPEEIRRFGEHNTPIREPRRAGTMCDDDYHDYLILLREELEANGYDIRQSDPGDPYYSYIDPALRAEGLQRRAENTLIKAGARMIGVDEPDKMNHRLICAGGMEKRQEFIDLLAKLVINQPGFENPIISN